MRIILPLLAALPAPAFAHIGHLGEIAGHSHWIGIGAIAVAGVIGALAAKGRKDKEKDAAEAAPEEAEA